MAELLVEKTHEEWWSSRLNLLELEYENSKLLVHQDGLMFDRWETDIDLLINDEKLHRESLNCEKLSQTSRRHEQILQDQIKSLEKELKESKQLLCQTKESLEDVKQKSKAEKERLQKRLALEAEERCSKEQEKFNKERDTLSKEIEKWKYMKEKLEVEMKENEKMLGLEADDKFKQQEKEANSKIQSLNEQLQTWKDKHAKTVQEVEGLQRELADKNVVSKTKATQTQNKMVNKSVMAGVEYNTMGIQTELTTECVNKEQIRVTRNSVHHSLKDHAESVHHSHKDHAESVHQTSGSENDQQSDKQPEKNTDRTKAKQKRTRNSRKSVKSKHKKTSDEEDEVVKDEEHNDVPGDMPTGQQETRDDTPMEMDQEVPTGAEKNIPTVAQDMSSVTPDDVPTELDEEAMHTGAKTSPRTGEKNLPTAVAEKQPNGHQASDKESSNQTVKRVRKRKCKKDPCRKDDTNAKKNKASGKTKGSEEDKDEEEIQNSCDAPGKTNENRARVAPNGNGQQKRCCVSHETDPSCNTDKRRETSEQTNKENILKDRNRAAQGTRPVTAKGASKPKYPSVQPSMNDRTRQSSIAEMSSILNGTKRQRTLYNTKDTSLMVSFLPVQESFMSSSMSRGNKPNGTMPPSLSAFMRSFIAPKLKKKSN